MFFATLYYDSEWFKNDVNGAQLFLSTNVTGTTLSDSIKKTAKGKSEFWRVKTSVAISDQELSMLIVNYLNLKYVLKVDESTGEVSED